MQTLQTSERSQNVRLNWPQTRAKRKFTKGNTVAIPWGRGGGKSWFIAYSAFKLVVKYGALQRPTCKGVRIVILMPVLVQARKTIMLRMLTALRGDDPSLYFASQLGGKYNGSFAKIEFPGGSYIQFVSQEGANRGIRCDAVLADETDDIDKETYFAICQPWLSEPFSLGLTMLGGTPTRGRNGLLFALHKLAQDEHPGIFSLHHTWRDFPEHVSREVALAARHQAEALGRLAAFEREWECNFNSGEGLVYPMFDREVHVKAPPATARFSEYLVGIDWGWNDPGSILVYGVSGHGRDASAWLIHEVYQSFRTQSWWVERAKEVLAKFTNAKQTWFADPSRPENRVVFENAGCKTPEKIGGKTLNAIEDGIDAVADRVAVRETSDGKRFSRFYVDPACKNTIHEFESYRWKKAGKDTEDFMDVPEDANNHAMDPTRYAILTRFGKPSSGQNDTGDGAYTFG